MRFKKFIIQNDNMVKKICIPKYIYIIGCILAVFPFTACDTIEDWFGDESDKSNINKGLVLYYNFDDDSATDISGNQYNGILINAPSFIDDTPNGNGKSVLLNGFKEQSINIPYNPIGDSLFYSMSFWIKDFTTGKIISSSNSDNDPVFLDFTALLDGNERLFEYRTQVYGSGLHTFSGFDYSSIQEGSWHHLLIRFANEGDSKVVSLFVDGVLVDRQSVMYYGTSALKFQIGNNSEGTVSFKIDNFRLYNRSLTAKEVKMIYDAERK